MSHVNLHSLVPFSVFVIVPFMEFLLPVALKVFNINNLSLMFFLKVNLCVMSRSLIFMLEMSCHKSSWNSSLKPLLFSSSRGCSPRRSPPPPRGTPRCGAPSRSSSSTPSSCKRPSTRWPRRVRDTAFNVFLRFQLLYIVLFCYSGLLHSCTPFSSFNGLRLEEQTEILRKICKLTARQARMNS